MNQSVRNGTLLALIIGGLLLSFVVLERLAALLILVLIAIVITTSIDPLVTRLQVLKVGRFHISRALATLFVVLVGFMLLFGASTFLITTAIHQAVNIADNHKLQTELRHWVDHLAHKYPVVPNSATIAKRVRAQSGEIVGYLWSTTEAVFGLLGGLASVFAVFIFTFFFTTFKDGILYHLLQFIPPRYQVRTRTIGHHAAMKMGGWLRGQLLLAFIITLLVTLGMICIGFPSYSMLVGIIGGMGELIPMVGPYLALIPALLIVIFSDHQTWQIVAIIIYFEGLAKVEAYFLAPKIMQRNVGLHPVTTILALFVGGSFLGIVGALLAVPLAAGARIVLLEAIYPAIQGKSSEDILAEQPEARQQRCQELKEQRLLAHSPTLPATAESEESEA